MCLEFPPLSEDAAVYARKISEARQGGRIRRMQVEKVPAQLLVLFLAFKRSIFDEELSSVIFPSLLI